MHQIIRLSKIDLHRHLLGSVSVPTYLKIVKHFGLPLPTKDESSLYRLLTIKEPVKGLKKLFKPWPFFSRLIVSPEAVNMITYEALRDAAADNILYVELRTSWGLTGRENFSVHTFLQKINEAIDSAKKDFHIECRIILGITRHLMAKHHPIIANKLYKEILRAAVDFKDKCVVGFDLSGIEENYPPSIFKTFFEQVKKEGFHISIHCGETTGPDSIWQAIKDLSADRISHGLSAVNDIKLINEIIEKKIVIETCPSSNYLTSVIKSWEEHPIRYFKDKNINITVNTDNPMLGNTTLSKEYNILINELNFTMSDVKQTIKNAAEASFAPSELKKEIKRKICNSGVINL